MPIIPTYRRQERYSAPGVEMSSSAPNRMIQAYENDLQEWGSFSQSFLKFMESKKGKEKQKSSAVSKRTSAEKQKISVETVADGMASSEKEFSADEDLQIRQDMLYHVRNAVSDGQAVTSSGLDEFAAERFGNTMQETPAARDYMMLRAAAQIDERTASRQEREERSMQEEQIISAVGATASSAKNLERYLSAQLPAFEQRLKENGNSSEVVKKKADSLRAQTAVQNIGQAVSSGNASAAQEVFEKYASQMNDRQREECTEKIRWSAASLYARSLWQRAGLETDGTASCRQQWAEQQLSSETNTDLKTDVKENLELLCLAQQAREHHRQAGVYRTVAGHSGGEAVAFVETQSAMDPSEMRLLQRAALEMDLNIAPAAHAGKFNDLYFSASAKDISHAYEKKQISAKEFCLLQAVRHERAAGEDDTVTRLLCKGIDLWREKKGLSEQETQSIKYRVLSASGGVENQLDAWRRIKALFDI